MNPLLVVAAGLAWKFEFDRGVAKTMRRQYVVNFFLESALLRRV